MSEKGVAYVLAFLLVLLIISVGILIGCQRDDNVCPEARCPEGHLCFVSQNEFGQPQALCYEVGE